ncbi:hypothetical protein BU16DRAFT_6633 [Lophium mytilinum]|uniref:Uncharacterized protein n=1 Tax=Lophium mytilinum TaxID=390894 RepID=A0A6A6RDA2_9PEZI|nr:hypothetical protein BU16DRAFT_6633 [Lophium mytilinum]
MPHHRKLVPGRDHPAPEHYTPRSMLPSFWGGRRSGMHRTGRGHGHSYEGYESGGENARMNRQRQLYSGMRGHRRSGGFPMYKGYESPYSSWGQGGVGGLGAPFRGAPYNGGYRPHPSPYLRNQFGMRPQSAPWGPRPGIFNRQFGHHAVRTPYSQQPFARGMGGGMGGGFRLGGYGGMGGFPAMPRRRPTQMRRARSYMEDDDDLDGLGDDSSHLGTFSSYDRYGSSHPTSTWDGDTSDFEEDEGYSDDEDEDYFDESGSSFGGRRNHFSGFGRHGFQ